MDEVSRRVVPLTVGVPQAEVLVGLGGTGVGMEGCYAPAAKVIVARAVDHMIVAYLIGYVNGIAHHRHLVATTVGARRIEQDTSPVSLDVPVVAFGAFIVICSYLYFFF